MNLDPANDHIPYPCAINIAELITLEDAMETLELGPNGGMMYCMEFLQKNLDWLVEKLKPLDGTYCFLSWAREKKAMYLFMYNLDHLPILFWYTP